METTPETAAGIPATDAPDPEGLDEAKNLVNLFLKALKAYRLYLPNNRTLQGFVDTYCEALDRFLRTHGELCFRISQFRISYEGTPVYENQMKEESLAFRLFIHGVREFTFHEGVPASEVADFLQVINRSFEAKTSVDDLLTLLWEWDLRFITFIVLDDFFEEGEQSEFEEFVEEGQRADSTASSMKVTMQPLLDRLLSRTGEVEPRPFPEIFDLTQEEVDRLNGWIEEETERDLIQALCGVLLDLIDPNASVEETRGLLAVIEQVLEALLTEGKFTEAMRVLRQLRDYGEGTEEDCAVRKLAREAIDEIGGDRMIRLVAPHVARAHGERREFLIDFLSTMDQTAMSALLDLAEKSETKEFAWDVLRRMASRHFSVLIVRLKDPRRSVVISVIRLLADLGDTRALSSLRAFVTHEDPAIRREAIRAVGAIGSDSVVAMLQPVLADEQQDIRVAAIRAIAESAPTTARAPLLEIARARDFPRRTYFEKKEVLNALAAVANQEIEDWLLSVVKKRAWLRREERDELRACAVSALARIGSEQAVEVLRACTEDRSPQVRRAASQAIRGSPPGARADRTD